MLFLRLYYYQDALKCIKMCLGHLCNDEAWRDSPKWPLG